MSATAGPALIDAVAADVDRLCTAEPDVRQDLPDSVHKMRVATRRLRSVLKSYRRVLRRRAVGEITDELRWLGGLLGVARDAEVRAERFTALLGDTGEPLDDAVPASVDAAVPASAKQSVPAGEKSARREDFGQRLVAAERAIYADAHRAVVDAFDNDRYTALLGTLHALITDPPLKDSRAAEPAEPAFTKVLRRDLRELRHLVHSEHGLAGAERIELLHDIRKAAKRLRYSAEAATTVLGKPAENLGKQAKHLQGVLGDHRDAVEALHTIRTHVADADSSYQRLCDAEETAAARALEQYPDAVEFVHHHPLD
ncbi:CHAD domain-containing protein [Nocardia tengchongensis]|uniref:CHAD domain-containing protein n=1 Tax=Nocardia tengchongensis TaxID=2055889 RepID=A0ABX8CWD6_9NOCA|nr:CHAD domain-containing protein [Nocardia tengchongensis]QVI24208.1 CHAD domain-containing protein [Nocardia tengchongensis]